MLKRKKGIELALLTKLLKLQEIKSVLLTKLDRLIQPGKIKLTLKMIKTKLTLKMIKVKLT